MAKWYKCPRCVRFCVLHNKHNGLYECGECLKTFSRIEFESNKLHHDFDIDPPGTKKLIKEVMKIMVK